LFEGRLLNISPPANIKKYIFSRDFFSPRTKKRASIGLDRRRSEIGIFPLFEQVWHIAAKQRQKDPLLLFGHLTLFHVAVKKFFCAERDDLIQIFFVF
jgi:hypothetical protein